MHISGAGFLLFLALLGFIGKILLVTREGWGFCPFQSLYTLVVLLYSWRDGRVMGPLAELTFPNAFRTLAYP